MKKRKIIDLPKPTLEREKLELLRMRATGTVDVPDIDGGEEFDEEDMT